MQDKIDKRLSTIKAWLAENAPYVTEDQKHLNAGSEQQAYWQYGYAAALADIKKLLSA